MHRIAYALLALAGLTTCGDAGPAAPIGHTPAARLPPGYLPARSVEPLALRSAARAPAPPALVDPTELAPDQPENVVFTDETR